MDNKCWICGRGDLKLVEGSKHGHEKKILQCNDEYCGAYDNPFRPEEYQRDFITDPKEIKVIFGAFGTGKTVLASILSSTHCMTLKNANVALYAQNIEKSNTEQLRRISQNIPDAWIKYYTQPKGDGHKLNLINGSMLTVFSSRMSKNFRSAEFTLIYGDEISSTPQETYDEAIPRARATNAVCYERDSKGNIRSRAFLNDSNKIVRKDIQKFSISNYYLISNPDINWVKQELLLKASTLVYDWDALKSTGTYSKTPEELYHRNDLERNNYLSVHIQVAKQNPHNPDNYLEKICQGKPKWWIDRYANASFEFSEGLIFKRHQESVIEPIIIKPEWERYSGIDFGVSDPTVKLMGARIEDSNILHIYEEYYENDKSVAENSVGFKKMELGIVSNKLNFLARCDSTGVNKQIVTNETLIEEYAKKGVYLDPAPRGKEVKLARVLKVHSMMVEGTLKIHTTCPNLIRELKTYIWDIKRSSKFTGEKPTNDHLPDGDDHSIDALLYLISLWEEKLDAREHNNVIKAEGTLADLYGDDSELKYKNEFEDFDNNAIIGNEGAGLITGSSGWLGQ